MTPAYDAVLFDMDGTLIDDSRSYREATRLTVQRRTGLPVSDAQILAVKSVPGFNNDWDVCWALVRHMRGELITVPNGDERMTDEYCQIRSVFQTYYLGSDGWEQRSGETAPFAWDEPLILRETPIISPQTVAWLRSRLTGIATSRPRAEALMAIRQHDLTAVFAEHAVVGLEDAPHEKPHPDPLLELAARLGISCAVYVGDTINDALAAAEAGMDYIHVGGRPLPAEVAQHAIHILHDVNEIAEVL